MTLGTRPYDPGLADLGNGVWAWLQPDGSWGWSNAGLLVDGDESLLIDTLFDEVLTGRMLDAMGRAVPGLSIGTLVNTHANGDHCNGNGLLPEADIIASKACAEEMAHERPETLARILRNADAMGETGAYFRHCFGAFDFEGVNRRAPTTTFSGQYQVRVGDRRVELLEVGPAHTNGDVLAWVPDTRTVFTGDILFIEGHPIVWAGPVSNWTRACDRMIELDPEHVVPGHGPVTDLRGVRAVRDYLTYVHEQASARHAAGMDPFEAALDISLDGFRGWTDAERIVINVDSVYRELNGAAERTDVAELFARMAKAHRMLRG